MKVEDVWEATPANDSRDTSRRLAMAAESGKVDQLLRSREMRVLSEPTRRLPLARLHPLNRVLLALKAAVRRNG